ncbi:NAD(P)-binding protein, partial [Gymnopus androsaceus JB14]
VTGGTGFVGSHIITQLLAKGYRVRAAARSASKLQGIFSDAPVLEVVEMPTLLSDYSENLKGVDAVIHVASPLFSKGAPRDEIFHAAYDGTLHIVRQSIDAGIKKIIITGTFASLFDSELKIAFGKELVTEKFFNSVTLDTLDRTQKPMTVYQHSKTIADKKVWELAKEHPTVDFTVLLPPAICGPLVPNYPLSDSSDSIGTNASLCKIFTIGTGAYPDSSLGHLIDVRDVARAHVAALSAPSIPGRDKRFIISSSTYKWKDVADLIRRERPELANRLPKEDAVPPKQTDAPLDTRFAAEVLGMEEYIPWEETVLAGIDAGVAWEKQRKNI